MTVLYCLGALLVALGIYRNTMENHVGNLLRPGIFCEDARLQPHMALPLASSDLAV